MALANGVHHMAISTADMKAQLEFFTDVLGAELTALYWMHGAEGMFHGFVKLADASYVAFVYAPKNSEIERTIGITHAGTPVDPSAPGTLQHVAFNVDTRDDLLALRDRIRSRGINVVGPINHGMCQSIYFAGPENLTLEVATSEVPIDGRAWIDPEVVALVGIDDEGLAAMMNPAPFESQGGGIPQPPVDETKPQMTYDPVLYDAIVSLSDEDVWNNLSEPEPPVKFDR
ncbi:VOC family protein [Rhodococcus pyridinivorans]|uniref:VOC family protein n=1 Tax=Rhodococcus pyridinivorans TaxID=103816 RepID=UPI001E59F3E0|nr:VOC family protein [Rhodococcus pyridinivorans]MCD5422436.1 VOC family protein [Rhodococcus pyridinivorans]